MTKLLLATVVLMLANCGESAPRKDGPLVLVNDTNASNSNTACDVCAPPAPYCIGNTAVSPTATCTDGECGVDESSRQDCSTNGSRCQDGACIDDSGLCAGVTCDLPTPACDGDVARQATGGSCVPETGECEFSYAETNCAPQGLVCRQGTCVEGRKRVFVTANRYNGDLARQGNSRVGSEGAHAICNAEAAAAGIGGEWYAFISDSDREVLEERERLAFPYYFPDRETLVVEDSADLFVTYPLYPIDVFPDGTRMPVGEAIEMQAWTGTRGSGSVADVVFDCSEWTDGTSSEFGVYGLIDDDLPYGGAWTYSDRGPCNEERRLYCFEL